MKKPQIKENLDERLKFEKLASRLSARLIDHPVHEIDEAIEEGLRSLAEFFEADRALIIQFLSDTKEWSRSHFWFSDRFDPKKVITQDGKLRSNAFPLLTESLMKEGAVVFENLSQIPQHWKDERKAAKAVGVKSGVSVRLSVGGSFLGAIGIDTVQTEHTWPEDVVQRLKFMGEIFANALNRKRTQEALEERMRFETLLSTLMAELTNIVPQEIDKVIEEGLRLLGEFFDADRATISQPLEKGKRYWPSHIWLSERYDLKSHLSALKGPFSAPNLMKHLHREGFYIYNKQEDIPKAWKEERSFMTAFGAKAGALVVLRIREEVHGVITLISLRCERVWPKDLVQRLRFIGEIFARALLCKTSEGSLGKAFSEIETLKSRLKEDTVLLKEEIKTVHDHHEIVGQSEAIKNVMVQVEQVAGTDSTVLLLGETGTGKELIARAIHESSPRREQAMVQVNCAAMPSTLVESELFGHEKGAYTGAFAKQIGRFEAANRGTLFLDEIGELLPEMQAKLLRVLQEGRFERLGSPESQQVDARLVAATNQDLVKAVQEGRFREDLYYRLNVFPISIPPLRQRREDIPLLVWAFVKEFREKMGKQVENMARKDMEALQGYLWPGNIRELRNVIERAMILSQGSTLPIEIPKTSVSKSTQAITLEEMAKKHIIEVLEITGWRVRGEGGAAKILGLKPTTLEARMQKLGIERKK